MSLKDVPVDGVPVVELERLERGTWVDSVLGESAGEDLDGLTRRSRSGKGTCWGYFYRLSERRSFEERCDGGGVMILDNWRLERRMGDVEGLGGSVGHHGLDTEPCAVL